MGSKCHSACDAITNAFAWDHNCPNRPDCNGNSAYRYQYTKRYAHTAYSYNSAHQHS